MRRRFITKQDIDECADAGTSTIEIDEHVTVTDLAREHARSRGVRLVDTSPSTHGAAVTGPSAAGAAAAGSEAPAGGAAAGGGAPSDGAASAGDTAGASHTSADRAQLHGQVRAAVIARVGAVPEGLDAAITRVLTRP